MTRKNTAAADTTPATPAPADPSYTPAPAAPPSNDNGGGGSTALAKPVTGDLLGELALEGDVLDDDGLREVDRSDRKLTILMINFGGMGGDGRAVPKDSFYNTVTEQTKDEVFAVFVSLHKTRVWSTFDEGLNKTVVHCRSFDQVQGTLANGDLRPCEGCPDWKWYEQADPKTGKLRKMRNCAPVYNVASVDKSTQEPFLIRFKKTALPPFKNHLQKFHLDRRPLGGGRMGNYPLYAFGARLTAKMASSTAKHAVPVIEHTGVLSREEIVQYAETAKALAGEIRAMIERADTVEAGGGADDTTFDTDAMGGAPSGFVDATGDDFVAPPTPKE